jgi:vancomycin resistance protein VanW
MKLKALIPKSFKLKYQLLKRNLNDRRIPFASKSSAVIPFSYSILTQQEIKQGPFFENKIHNLKTGSKSISSVTVLPNHVFSFWRIVGSPDEQNGFKKGRNIIKGNVSEEIGGGLCQLSSIIYITALKVNLEIVERYNHSVDIYKEEDRFTPLGADATVVYGYKDLRFRNNFAFPIRFNFTFTDNQLICHLESVEKMDEKQLDFIRYYKENNIEVATHLNSTFYCTSVYKTMALN